MSGTIDLDTFNPVEPATLDCLDAYYTAMRAGDPVHYVKSVDMYFVVRHDLICRVMRDAETFSSVFPTKARGVLPIASEDAERIREVLRQGLPRVPTLINADPPAHNRYRQLVARTFSVKAIAALEPVVRMVTSRLIDSWIDQPQIEFVDEFAVPLPMEVIAYALGVPDDRLDDFKRWSDDTVASFGAAPSIERRIAAEQGVNELQRYFSEQLDLRRAEPQDDLLTRLLQARIDDTSEVTDDRPLDTTEIVGILQQLLSGGNETTTKLLAAMMRTLAEQPEHWKRVRADPAAIPGVVEETLRLAAPAQCMRRLATRDVELGGVTIPAGSRIITVLASANRDESVFTDPESFDPHRDNLNDHLAFGKGVHFCIGASLTRLEARVALEELSRRLRSFALADDNDFPHDPSFMLRGLKRLQIDIVAA
ncbi:MAG TPA: cytochrome P450 [Ilumatobacter sp.]|nr:cytochrome P450 [Ilumatobacter sp.]